MEISESVEENSRRRRGPGGAWAGGGNGNPICPVCGEDKFKDLDADIWCDWQPDFCPNCGAKMDGGADNG